MRRIFLLAFCLALAACASPSAVQGVGQYAQASARLAADTTLTRRFRDTYRREQPYLNRQADAIGKTADRRRRAAYADLTRMHDTLAAYMQTLARVAGAQASDTGTAGGALTEGLAGLPGTGIKAAHADAYGKVAAAIARAAAGNYQQTLLAALVRENQADVATLLDGLKSLAALYRKTHDNERRTVLGMLEAEVALAAAPKERLVQLLGRAHLQDKSAEYSAAHRKYTVYEKGLDAVAEGHRALAERIDRLADPDTQAMLAVRAAEIEARRPALLIDDADEDDSGEQP